MTDARLRGIARPAASGRACPPAQAPLPVVLALLALALLLAAPPACLAQRVELSSPLGGNVRPGRAAAVRVVADGLAGPTLTLGSATAAAAGTAGVAVVPVRIPLSGGRVDAVVPMLFASDPPAALDWSDGRSAGTAPVALRPLGVDDRLVAVAGDPALSADGASADKAGGTAVGTIGTTAAAVMRFPSARAPVVVTVDTSRSNLLAPAAAYEAVDVLLLDPAAAARMDEGQLRTLLAGGTTVAVRAAGDAPAAGRSPAGTEPAHTEPTAATFRSAGTGSSTAAAVPVPSWPWERVGGWWVLRHDVVGPRGVSPDVYAPTYAWDRSWPAATRRSAVLAAAAVALAVLGASLWRSRWATAVAVGVCLAAAVAAAAYGLALSPAATAAGEVVAWDGRLAQRDRWRYVSARRDGSMSVPAAADGLTKPAPFGRRPVAGLTVALACAADGSPLRYELTLPAKATVAFLTRTVGPEAPPPVPAPAGGGGSGAAVTVPVGLFADKLYPGTVAGQSEDRPPDAADVGAWWGTVVMRK